MRLLGNILWFVFGGGIIAGLSWLLWGAVLAFTVVGIPFAIAAFRIAGFAFWPFGRELVDARWVGEDRVLGTSLTNFLWVVLAGLWLTIGHAIVGLFLCLTLIGIPFGLAHFKLASVSFAPLGKRVVSTSTQWQLAP